MFENIPTPEEAANNFYDFNTGNCLDCTPEARAHPGYKQWVEPILNLFKEAAPIDGVPQIKYVNIFAAAGAPDNPTQQACFNRVNQLALDNPQWGKKAGQDGMIRVATVCMWEARGEIPDGYMQQVINAVAKRPAFAVPTWAWVAGAGVAALLLLRR